MLKTDGALIHLAGVFGGDSVHHAGGIEGPHHVASPFFALQKPAQQHGKTFVGIHKAAIFGYGADTVGIAVSG